MMPSMTCIYDCFVAWEGKMGKGLKLCVLLLAATLIFGCGHKNNSSNSGGTANLRISPEYASLPENNPVTGHKLVKKAKSAIGTPYVLGGSAPGGFDCSGLVKWTYDSVGVELPRTAREQASVGKKVKDVKDMRAGDIVAFRHPKRGYHTGIYVGDGKFVHSPRKRTTVRINSLSDPYFKSTLLGARRVNLDGSENLIAQSESRLREYVAEKSKLTLSARNLEKIKSTAKKHNSAQPKSRKATTAASVKSGKKQNAANTNAKKKSTIASNASKIKSIKTVTGKNKLSAANGDAHAKLASASKKASHKTVSMLQNKSTPKMNHSKKRNHS